MFLIISTIIFPFYFDGYAFEKKTHEAINRYIAEHPINGFSLDQYLRDELRFMKGKDEVPSGTFLNN